MLRLRWGIPGCSRASRVAELPNPGVAVVPIADAAELLRQGAVVAAAAIAPEGAWISSLRARELRTTASRQGPRSARSVDQLRQ